MYGRCLGLAPPLVSIRVRARAWTRAPLVVSFHARVPALTRAPPLVSIRVRVQVSMRAPLVVSIHVQVQAWTRAPVLVSIRVQVQASMHALPGVSSPGAPSQASSHAAPEVLTHGSVRPLRGAPLASSPNARWQFWMRVQWRI